MTFHDRSAGSGQLVLRAAVILVVAFVLGGGGSGHPVAELLIEAVALTILASLVLRPLPSRSPGAVMPLVLLLIVAVLIVAQLVPLPPGWWRALPGRSLAAVIADHVGLGDSAYPISLDPAATRRSLVALLPSAAMLTLVIHMDLRQRTLLACIVIGCALASLMLAVVQLATAGAWGTIYPEGHVGYATGLFANRNHQAAFLLVATALTGALPQSRSMGALLPLSLAVALGAGVIATTSRAGFVLLPIALLPVLLGQWRIRWWWMAPLWCLAVTAAVSLARHNTVIALVVERLHSGNLERFRFWGDSWTAITRFWPVGSGFGTFETIFRSVEPLDHVGPHYVNHAHNEYLELILEGGLPAMLLLLLAVVWAIRRCVAIPRLGRDARRLAWASAAGLLALLLHSLVDYPTRILAIQLLAAMLAGFLTKPAPSLSMIGQSIPRLRASFLPSIDKAGFR
ncbi:O-antigen ligase family protein [Sphingomonas sp. CFBP8993]|uniref:O-antigen ligase family protein n=1 Tax=Sphingomonas sp. CFBP8993 TaxID=3096526 RepID=UPI002A6A1DB1|nr:O-antigen ligase family protein [Sphingomonas sp. CFBP8993]MDY0958982.1 O-antigen ligase family protein [Sphingomonas sp. CFBP8993]